jgi:hypothetical protein
LVVAGPIAGNPLSGEGMGTERFQAGTLTFLYWFSLGTVNRRALRINWEMVGGEVVNKEAFWMVVGDPPGISQ